MKINILMIPFTSLPNLAFFYVYSLTTYSSSLHVSGTTLSSLNKSCFLSTSGTLHTPLPKMLFLLSLLFFKVQLKFHPRKPFLTARQGKVTLLCNLTGLCIFSLKNTYHYLQYIFICVVILQISLAPTINVRLMKVRNMYLLLINVSPIPSTVSVILTKYLLNEGIKAWILPHRISQ